MKAKDRNSKKAETPAARVNFNPPPPRVSLNVSFDVDIAQMATWQPERISRFFRGIATILEARQGRA